MPSIELSLRLHVVDPGGNVRRDRARTKLLRRGCAEHAQIPRPA